MKNELSIERSWMDIFWRQRAKQHWIKFGDRNTKFFPRVANFRRKFNAILKIKVDDLVFDEDSAVKGAIVHYYESLSHEEHPLRPLLDEISYNSIIIDDALVLKWVFQRRKCGKLRA